MKKISNEVIEMLGDVGSEVAGMWGGECISHEVDETEGEVVFFCIEHGERFTTSIPYSELPQYLPKGIPLYAEKKEGKKTPENKVVIRRNIVEIGSRAVPAEGVLGRKDASSKMPNVLDLRGMNLGGGAPFLLENRSGRNIYVFNGDGRNLVLKTTESVKAVAGKRA